MTGWDCPGCGGLRAAHQLLHGVLAAAWALNPLVPVSPVLGAFIALARRLPARPPAWLRRNGPAWWGVLLILFGLARNAPRLWSALN